MKTLFSKIGYNIGRLLRWRWLMMVSGKHLIPANKKNREDTTDCYMIQVVEDKPADVEISCYKVAVPQEPDILKPNQKSDSDDNKD
jgi:hypothetical protein